MKGEILAIGTELLMGELVDTNSHYIAAQLPSLGIQLLKISGVGDSQEAIVEEIHRVLKRSDILFTIGGLGPTHDDLTRESIAQALGEKLYTDEGLLKEIKDYFKGRGVPMAEANVKQASLIPSAVAITNARGTAPGWWVEKGGHLIIALPGPPGELENMWREGVLPRLQRLPREKVILTRTLKTYGLPEATLAERVQHLLVQGNPEVGIYAKPEGVYLRIIANGNSQESAQALITPLERGLRERISEVIWGVDEETLESNLGRLLKEKGLTLSTLESCTGGLLASTITDVPGSSGYFKGGAVTYANEAKASYGVDPSLIKRHGAVSPQVAEAMAQAAAGHFRSDVAIGITGVAGPSALEGKPPGTVYIGLAYRGSLKTISARYPPQRPLVKRRAVTQALLECYRLVAG